ncbi:MAG: alternative ribosome rescue aminoacyl-tRNA hydrolase ArfB [Gammaproteobacteria bacterium]|nr:alternative ribosome rescue aminoacyl-tRNA hydrolase ArfB [Gammaproteobacteria bacterium]MCY4344845.1 alternative ribosome rescue aminoacyl-tRNA hydrolase ArfB [Gammaproteobacteria bacterium]
MNIGGIDIPPSAIAWKFVRSRGPGGQNVNKVATAVECRLSLKETGMDPGVCERLKALAASRLTAAGDIVIFADTHRTQQRNREAALERLGALIEHARRVPKRRIPTVPGAGAKARRRDDKRRRAGVKELRGRLRPSDDI